MASCKKDQIISAFSELGSENLSTIVLLTDFHDKIGDLGTGGAEKEEIFNAIGLVQIPTVYEMLLAGMSTYQTSNIISETTARLMLQYYFSEGHITQEEYDSLLSLVG